MTATAAILAEQIRKAVQAGMETESHSVKVHDTIAEMLRTKYAGKKITKRFADELRARMGWPETAICHYKTDYGLHQIEVWRVAPWYEFNDRTGFYLRSEIGNVEEFERADTAHGSGAKERQAKRAALLANPKAIAALAKAIAAYQRALKEINTAFEGVFTADRYTIEKIVKGEGE